MNDLDGAVDLSRSEVAALAAIGRTTENMTAIAVEAGGVEVFRMVS